MLPECGVDLPAVTVEQGVIDHYSDRLPLADERGDHRPRQQQPDRIRAPLGVRKEPVCPAVMSASGQPGRYPHASDGPPAGRPQVASDQRDEVANVGAVNAPRTTCSTSSRPAGTVSSGSIGESSLWITRHVDASAISADDHSDTPVTPSRSRRSSPKTAKLQVKPRNVVWPARDGLPV